MARKLARLTPIEDKWWEAAFSQYVNDGMSDARADRLAWYDTVQQFPRLREFDGCKP